MVNTKIRINKITLWDLKNVSHGVIDLNAAESLRQEKANIMGLYGQNASGKTVVIEALAIIQHILIGQRIPPHYLESIANGKDECSIEIEFAIMDEDNNFDCIATYKCTLSKRNDPNDNNEPPQKIIAVIYEKLSAQGIAYGKKFRKQEIAQSDEHDSIISPTAKCDLLFGTNPNVLKKLEQQKILALYGSRSFIFSQQVLVTIYEASVERNPSEDALMSWPAMIIMLLRVYAGYKLFVIDERAGQFNFYMFDKNETIETPHGIPILQDNGGGVVKASIENIENLLPSLNTVLSSIVPSLTLKHKYEKISLDESNELYRLEFFSHREGIGIIPFRNESLGIKKIVSFIVLLIEAYNNPGFTLAIDEMDSGIFEYLLGEILSIMGSSGKGQLLFTSHNLCPLEKIDSSFVWFSTNNPQKRYAQLTTKATNNLRDMYLRAIHLGADNNQFYNGDSKHAIAHAFRKMGRREQ